MLDITAETLLERYQRAGEDRDAVDAVSWMCRALGASGNSRYRPVLEHVENDKSVHRKGRGHCEKAAKGLPKEVSNPYTAGTVNLETAAQSTAAAAAARSGHRQGQEEREGRAGREDRSWPPPRHPPAEPPRRARRWTSASSGRA